MTDSDTYGDNSIRMVWHGGLLHQLSQPHSHFLRLEDAQGLCVNLAVNRLYNLAGVVLGCDPAYVAQVADSNVRSLGIDDVCLSCLQETDSADEVIEYVAILFYSEDSDRLATPPSLCLKL